MNSMASVDITSSEEGDLPSHLYKCSIDFGSTSSGYAFQRSGCDSLREVETSDWSDGSGGKTSSAVLIDPAASENALEIGERAWHRFRAQPRDCKHLLFANFKMSLFCGEKPLHLKLMLDDVTKRSSFLAIDVIALLLKALKNHFFAKLATYGEHVAATDVLWSLTVPAIWQDAAKQFMRRAAFRAGLFEYHEPERLLLTFEPESAGIYCRQMRSRGLDHGAVLVIDSGGGTVDLAVLRRSALGQLSSEHAPSGGAWGSSRINNALLQFVEKLVTPKLFGAWGAHDPAGRAGLLQAVEKAKTSWDPTSEYEFMLELPGSLLIKLDEELSAEPTNGRGRGLEELCEKYCAKNPACKARVEHGRLFVHRDTATQFYERPIYHICNHVREVFSRSQFDQLTAVCLVGGFSACRYLQQRLTDTINEILPNLLVYVPRDPYCSVMKGAVAAFSSGTNDAPRVTSRVASQSYGVQVTVPYEERHRAAKVQPVEKFGQQRCPNVFRALVLTGDSVTVGRTISHRVGYHEDQIRDGVAVMHVFSCPRRDVYFTTDADVRRVATVRASLLPTQLLTHERKGLVQFRFGMTEIEVSHVSLETGATVRTVIDFLSSTDQGD